MLGQSFWVGELFRGFCWCVLFQVGFLTLLTPIDQSISPQFDRWSFQHQKFYVCTSHIYSKPHLLVAGVVSSSYRSVLHSSVIVTSVAKRLAYLPQCQLSQESGHCVRLSYWYRSFLLGFLFSHWFLPWVVYICFLCCVFLVISIFTVSFSSLFLSFLSYSFFRCHSFLPLDCQLSAFFAGRSALSSPFLIQAEL